MQLKSSTSLFITSAKNIFNTRENAFSTRSHWWWSSHARNKEERKKKHCFNAAKMLMRSLKHGNYCKSNAYHFFFCRLKISEIMKLKKLFDSAEESDFFFQQSSEGIYDLFSVKKKTLISWKLQIDIDNNNLKKKNSFIWLITFLKAITDNENGPIESKA